MSRRHGHPAHLRLLVALLLVGAATLSACGTSGGRASAGATLARKTQTHPQTACVTGGRSTDEVAGAPLDTILRVPPGDRTKRAALVVALHFASGTGRAMEQETRLTTTARRAGFDVAYPTASTKGFWRASDLDALEETIAAVERTACIDSRRIYVLGWSNGGGMAALTACRLADQVAAVVLLAPATGFTRTCQPSRNVPILELHGTSDAIVPYAKGRAYLDTWAERQGCSAAPATDRVRAGVTRLRWPSCGGDGAVQELRLRRGRHVELVRDFRAAGVDPASAAWDFLSSRRLGS